MKPKLNLEKYPGVTVMYTPEEWQYNILSRFLHNNKRKWTSGKSYIDVSQWEIYKHRTCISFNDGSFSPREYFRNEGYEILKFDDFDWSEYGIQELTKSEIELSFLYS